MNSVIQQLWRDRDRFPFARREWCRAWAKRLLTSSHLFRQFLVQARLRRGGVLIGENTFISGENKIQGKLEKLSIGPRTYIGCVQIAVHDWITIGSRVCINDGSILLSASHDVRSPHWTLKTGKILVKDYAWIATNAIILPGVEIGYGAVVGAGAVVSKNVPDYAVAIGNPAVIREDARAKNLSCDPTAHLACFTAWKRLPSREAQTGNGG